MTNAELIAKLSKLSPDAEIVIFADDIEPMNGKTRLAVYECLDDVYGHYISIDADK